MYVSESKKPRLLESGPNFPLVYPNGKDGYDFYFQSRFEKISRSYILKNKYFSNNSDFRKWNNYLNIFIILLDFIYNISFKMPD